MADSFPENLEVLFQVPQAVADEDLRIAVAQLAESIKTDLVATGAPVEVIMEGALALNQFAKHMQATRHPLGFPELGGYGDPSAERAAQSSLNSTLTTLRDSMAKLRVVRTDPAAVQAAVEERDRKFFACAQSLFSKALDQCDPLYGHDLQFWVQETLFTLMKGEGLVE